MTKDILTPEESLYVKMRNDGFYTDEIAKILSWEISRVKEIGKKVGEKIKIAGYVPKLYFKELLPKLEPSSPKEYIKYEELTLAQIEAGGKGKRMKHMNLLKFLSGANGDELKMPRFYNDSTFVFLGYEDKIELMGHMNLLVSLGLVKEVGNQYRLTELYETILKH